MSKLLPGPGSICANETHDIGDGELGHALKGKYEAYEKVTYTTKDGAEKVKKGFRLAAGVLF